MTAKAQMDQAPELKLPGLTSEQAQALAKLQQEVQNLLAPLSQLFGAGGVGHAERLPALSLVNSKGVELGPQSDKYQVNSKAAIHFDKDTLKFTGKMAIDTDGAGPSGGDKYYQPRTSYKHNGQYLHAGKDPFIVLPIGTLKATGAKLGDICMVEFNGKKVFAIVGDMGPSKKLGEASVAVAKALGAFNSVHEDAGKGSREFKYTVFKGTSHLTERMKNLSELQNVGPTVLAARQSARSKLA